MDLLDKLTILTDAAKYDVACTSSGAGDRAPSGAGMGSTADCGICHSWSADGRCISLLKVLMTNRCVYDCRYCVNRRSSDTPRAAFEPAELAELTMRFYRRNYIEGLFLSSGVDRSPDHATEQMIRALELLRGPCQFTGYIHAKAIPGTDPDLIARLGLLADRLSVNIELPSQKSLALLAPGKTKQNILGPMAGIRDGITESRESVIKYKKAPRFAPAGQSTQMIVGATPETDLQILRLTQGLYRKFGLKRVFFSAYIPVAQDSLLPALDTKPPLLREHRLYQADWLLRFYHFSAEELLDEEHPAFNPFLDPKCNWALNHPELFPVEVNKAAYELLLRVPGIGPRSAARIVRARRQGSLDWEDLKRIGVVLKRAQYFLLCRGRRREGLVGGWKSAARALIDGSPLAQTEQLSLFGEPVRREQLREAAVECL
ncbi:MAG TPA: putative DNA modification/repair radical SAM protein [Candidatus Pygmaiobacter gallistercoris]|nr:putative DNA modification/repair radical SAM protein [Candidatus Pygmaiobacter gallistercoris]